MIHLILENALVEQSLIGIRTPDQDWDESIIGFVVLKDELSIVLKEIDEYGKLIGNTSIEIDQIINVDLKDRYQTRLAYIYKNEGLLNADHRVSIWKPGALLSKHLAELLESKEITTFYFDDDNYVIGVILEYDETYLKINNIGSDGLEDGMSLHLISDLSGLRFNGLEEQKIKLLLNNPKLF
jgi:hypothetical protein